MSKFERILGSIFDVNPTPSHTEIEALKALSKMTAERDRYKDAYEQLQAMVKNFTKALNDV